MNVSTRERTLVKSLRWKPFCLDAAYGWICVGGDDNGQCAFIRINDTGIGRANTQSHAEVDDLLPLDLDPEYRHIRHDFRPTPEWPRYPRGPTYELQHHELGGDRVNSVKIQLIPNGKQKLENEIVAVMT